MSLSNGQALPDSIKSSFIALRLYAGKCLVRGLDIDVVIEEMTDKLRNSVAAHRIRAAGADFNASVRQAVLQAFEYLNEVKA
jgi:hypothetical protein